MIRLLGGESVNQRAKNESHYESNGESPSLKTLALKALCRENVNHGVNQTLNQRESNRPDTDLILIHNDSRQNETLMGTYPHLASCPLHDGSWVYRGQACEICGKRSGCPSWMVQTFTPRTDLPAGIVKPRRAGK